MAATLTRCAHLLLQVDTGRAAEVARYLSALPEIAEACVTSGPYDVIAVVDLSRHELSSALAHARRAPGLAGVRVCRPA
ncbi:MAG: hypothetical protein JWN88_1277 [Frankiales bacterium]|jgi:hypothetical protein|nr:hypothetical protein [Frankiales bacterium]